MASLHDMHIHLDFMENGAQVAECANASATLLFANTVNVDGYAAARVTFADFDNVNVGLGMHPWWVNGGFDAERFESLAHRERFIGEVGLDFGKRHVDNRQDQLDAFARIAAICARQMDKVLSLHAVHAAAEALDILEQAGTLGTCVCIFHWFTGPSDQLKRAIQAGCYFSVGPRMLNTGKGREYVKAIPAKQLLLETDAPPQPQTAYPHDEWRKQLELAAAGVARIKGDKVLDVIGESSVRLLGDAGTKSVDMRRH